MIIGVSIAVILVILWIIWCIYRNKKYPIAHPYRFLNKIVVPGFVARIPVVKFANKISFREKTPKVLDGLKKEVKIIKTKDNYDLELIIYSPKTDEALPCMIYLHGGGFFFKDQAYIHKIVMQYSKNSNIKIVFVRYRTSDEVAYPKPFNDCVAALEYVSNNYEELNIVSSKIAVGGDSAGGTLAASLCHYAKDNGIKICFQFLIYPVIDMTMSTNSSKEYTDSPVWNSMLNKRMWDIYLRDGYDKNIPEYFSPNLAKSFESLPPAFIEVCEFDSLKDEGLNYGKF